MRAASRTLWIFFVIAAVQAALLAPVLPESPIGQHTWRQTVGHAMTRNYIEENDGFWRPKNDIRVRPEDTGAIYHEFPIQYWVAAKMAKLTGAQPDLVVRLTQFLIVAWIGIAGVFFARGLGYSATRSTFFGFFMTVSPVSFYYMATVVPNFVGLTFFIAGLGALLHSCRLFTQSNLHTRSKMGPLIKPGLMVAGLAGVLLGTLIKPVYLFFGMPVATLAVMGLFLFQQRFRQASAEARELRRSLLSWLTWFAGGGVVIIGVNALVLRHARTLHEAAPPEQQVHTPMGPPPETIEGFGDLWHNLATAAGTWFMEMYVGLAALPFFLTGIWVWWRHLRARKTGVLKIRKEHLDTKPPPSSQQIWRSIFWAAWLCSFVIYASIFITRFADHDYYICSLLPVAALINSKGAEHLWNGLNRWNRHGRWIAVLICSAAFVMMFVRVQKRWTQRKQIPVELLYRAKELIEVIPRNERVLVYGDKTPIVFLYYLHRKGLQLTHQEPITKVEALQKNGFRYAVVYGDSAPPYLNELFPQEKARVGSFRVLMRP